MRIEKSDGLWCWVVVDDNGEVIGRFSEKAAAEKTVLYLKNEPVMQAVGREVS